MSGTDGRGSAQQLLIYDLVQQLYPKYNIEYEYPIGDLNQRIDIFVPTIGVAFEIHGIQHYKYNSFFFKDELAWNNSVNLDNRKVKYLKDKGVKLVEIPYNSKIKTVEELRQLVDSVDYPDTEYLGISTQSESEIAYKEKQKLKRKEYNKKQREYLKARKNNNEQT